MVNHKKIQRLWREEGLRVPQRRRRKRVGASTADAPSASAPNLVWVVDFQFDSDERGRPIKICSIVDEHTRECIAGLADRSITATKLTCHLEALAADHGTPATLRYDNGPELISEAMTHWAGTRTGLSYIPPGSPWRNDYIESFNSRTRDECLNINTFYSLLHTRVMISDWKTEYNHHRRHSSLGYLTPAEYARQSTQQTQTNDSHNVRTQPRGQVTPVPQGPHRTHCPAKSPSNHPVSPRGSEATVPATHEPAYGGAWLACLLLWCFDTHCVGRSFMMSLSAQPGAPGYGGSSHAPRPNRTPYFVAIGVLTVALVAVLVWALWPTSGGSSSNASTEPTPSTTDTQSEPPPASEPTPTPSTVAPTTQQPPTDNPIRSNQIAERYATLNEVLPKKLENWELELQEIGKIIKPVYRDGQRMIVFVALGRRSNPERIGEGQQELQQFDGGCCYLNPASTKEKRSITCAMELKAAPGQTFIMTSRYVDIDEMVRVAKALIAIEK